jgi:phosphatidylglycerophosphatase A
VKPLARLIATCFGCGYVPKAPGTAGSLAGLVVAWWLHRSAGFEPVSFLMLGLLALAPASWAANSVAVQTGLKDPPIVVVDEVLGQWIALGGATHLNWKSWAAAFLLFRLFDIWKPPPVRQLERVQGGAGIVLDDVAAGAYAALVLWAAGWFNLY